MLFLATLSVNFNSFSRENIRKSLVPYTDKNRKRLSAKENRPNVPQITMDFGVII